MLKKYRKKSRLLSYYTTEEKRRYKLYKRKTKWVIAGMAFFGALSISTGLAKADSLTDMTADVAVITSTNQAQAPTEGSIPSEVAQVKDDSQETQVSKVSEISSSKVQVDTNSEVKESVVTQTDNQVATSQITKQADKQTSANQENVKKQESEEQSTKTSETSKTAVELATPQKQATDTTTQAVDDSQVVAKVAQELQQLKGVSPEQAQTMAKDALVNDRQTALQLADLMTSSTDANGAVITPTQKQNAALLATNLATDSTTAGEYNGQDQAYVYSVTSNASGINITSTGQVNGGDLTYTLAQSNLYNRNVVTKIKYVAKKGDKVTMTITGNDEATKKLTGFDNFSNATGDPIFSRDNGKVQLTWTVKDGSEGATQEYIKTLPGVDWFREFRSNNYSSAEVPPYASAVRGDTIFSDGDSYTISFNITEKDGTSGTYSKGTTKIVLDKVGEIESFGFNEDQKSHSNQANKAMVVTTGTDYLYKMNYSFKSNTGDGNYFFSSAHVEVQVPEHFVLDKEATENYIKNNTPWYGKLTVTQAGEGQPIIFDEDGQIATPRYSDFPFIGYYTDQAQVNETKIFKITKAYITSNANKEDKQMVPAGAQMTELLKGKNEPLVHENWNTIFSYYENALPRPVWDSLTTRGDYDTSKEVADKTDNTKDWFNSRLSEINEPNSVLYAIGLEGTGATPFTPTYKLTIPDGITSTGIVMPLNYVDGKTADYNSYGPAVGKYKVIVTADDGSQVTQELAAGESYNPLTGEIDNAGKIRNDGAKISGKKVTKYEITPDTHYYANSEMYGNSDLKYNYPGTPNVPSGNDIWSGKISVLGFIDMTTDQDEIDVPVTVTSEHKSMDNVYRIHVMKGSERLIIPTNYDSVLGNQGNIQTVNAGNNEHTYTINVGGLSEPAKKENGKNLDAAGILTGNPNKTGTDLSGKVQDKTYSTIHPVFYITLPNNISLSKRNGHVYGASSNGINLIDEPLHTISGANYRDKVKMSTKTNDKGQIVLILDFSDPDIIFDTSSTVSVNYRVAPDAMTSMDAANTAEDYYEYNDPVKKV